MSKYRITIENIGPGADWDEDKIIECDGFAINADRGEEADAIIQDISVTELAADFAADDNLFAAACIAKAMREAINLPKTPIAKNPLAALLARMGDD